VIRIYAERLIACVAAYYCAVIEYGVKSMEEGFRHAVRESDCFTKADKPIRLAPGVLIPCALLCALPYPTGILVDLDFIEYAAFYFLYVFRFEVLRGDRHRYMVRGSLTIR